MLKSNSASTSKVEDYSNGKVNWRFFQT
jgi:hypothetical protein